MSSPAAPWMGSDFDQPDIEPRIDAALRTVIDPCSAATGAPLNLVDMGLIGRAEQTGDTVRVELRLTSPICWNAAPMMQAIEEAVMLVDGVEKVECTADHGLDWTPAHMTSNAKQRLQLLRPVRMRADG